MYLYRRMRASVDYNLTTRPNTYGDISKFHFSPPALRSRLPAPQGILRALTVPIFSFEAARRSLRAFTTCVERPRPRDVRANACLPRVFKIIEDHLHLWRKISVLCARSLIERGPLSQTSVFLPLRCPLVPFAWSVRRGPASRSGPPSRGAHTFHITRFVTCPPSKMRDLTLVQFALPACFEHAAAMPASAPKSPL